MFRGYLLEKNNGAESDSVKRIQRDQSICPQHIWWRTVGPAIGGGVGAAELRCAWKYVTAGDQLHLYPIANSLLSRQSVPRLAAVWTEKNTRLLFVGWTTIHSSSPHTLEYTESVNQIIHVMAFIQFNTFGRTKLHGGAPHKNWSHMKRQRGYRKVSRQSWPFLSNDRNHFLYFHLPPFISNSVSIYKVTFPLCSFYLSYSPNQIIRMSHFDWSFCF